ncbi:MAG: acetyl-CoA acetyltransferase [Pseudomonadota bacterium]
MKKDVAIVGVGQSPFYRKCGMAVRELCFMGFQEAMKGINLKPEQIDASVICSAPEYDKQRSPASVIADYLGIIPAPSFNLETLCSSSSTGVRVAYSLIKSGLHEVVAVIGFQKMSELTSHEAAERMGRGGDIQWESPFGVTMPGYFGMVASAHMAEYGTTPEQLARVRVKSSIYGEINEKAVYRKKISMEDVLNSEMVTSPLKKFDCCANADGAAVVILAGAEIARKITDKPVWVLGLGGSTRSTALSGRLSFTSVPVSREAAQAAYEMAGIGPEEIDVAEVHDCFTIAEIVAYEDCGFAKPGEGARLIDEKQTYLGGRIPVNLDGGLLSKGHPIGATGASQIRTLTRQLRSECGKTQVEGAKFGLSHNLGGPGLYNYVTILGRD